jgi:CHAT domain-containing protein/tetratricopeptide (TPR) repeat protein
MYQRNVGLKRGLYGWAGVLRMAGKILRLILPLSLFIAFGYGSPGPATEHPLHQLQPSSDLGSGGLELLKTGRIFKCNLIGAHTFALPTEGGQFVRIVVDRATVPVSVSIFSPAGLKTYSSSIERTGPYPISFVSSVSGQVKIEVRSANGESGSYQIKVDAVRTTLDTDSKEIDADRAFGQAEALRARWDQDSLQQAIDQYERALSYWQYEGGAEQQAVNLIEIGELDAILGRRREALRAYEGASVLSERAGYVEGRIEALNRMAELDIDMDLKAALDLLGTTQELSEKSGDLFGNEGVLNIRGLAAYTTGDLREALDFFGRAMSAAVTAGDKRGQAEILVNLGYSYFDRGEFAQALSTYREALDVARAGGFRDWEGFALTAIGDAQTILGDKQQAIDQHQDSLQIFDRIGDPYGQAVALNGLGYSREDLGELEEALDCYSKARSLYHSIGCASFEAQTIGYIAQVHRSLGELAEARKCINEKLAISRQIVDHRMELHTLLMSGDIWMAGKQHEKALESYSKALSLAEAIGDKRGQASALNRIGSFHDRANEFRKALDCYTRALTLSQSSGDRGSAADTLCNIASVERATGNLTEASARVQQSIEIIESLRSEVIGPRQRTSFFATMQRAYRLYIDILVRMDREDPSKNLAAEALEISEHARARSLAELLGEAHVDFSQGVDPALLERRQVLERALDTQGDLKTGLSSAEHSTVPDEELTQIERRIRDIGSELETVDTRIRETNSRYANLTRPQPLSMRAIQDDVLDSESVLLEYSLGDSQSYVWAVTKDSMVCRALPGRAEIERAVSAYLAAITARQLRPGPRYFAQVAEADRKLGARASELGRLLLDPVGSAIGTRRVIVAADGVLQQVPFAALPAPGPQSNPLLAEHEIVYVPSASAISVLRTELAKRPPAEKALGILADPVFQASDVRVKAAEAANAPRPAAQDPQLAQVMRDLRGAGDDLIQRLPATRREAEEIMQLVPPGQVNVAVDFQASLNTVVSGAFSRDRYVDFATHGVLDDLHPELSGLILTLVSEDGRRIRGFLRLQDVYNLSFSADMVSLSGCKTGLGKDTAGEGLVGLSRGFMYAGAASVLTSLWEVDDQATASLMKSLYTKLLNENMRPPAALRAAQLEMLSQKKTASPFYWAAFVLQGEWR